jgi:hypothetical protein
MDKGGELFVPDMLNGFSYLESGKKVISGDYESRISGDTHV